MTTHESIKNYLPSNFIPTLHDVVCARGKAAYLHPGNQRYRDIIDNNIDKYIGAKNSKNKKSAIVMTIVEEVRCDAPAGFVRYCNKEQLWYEIGDEAAREKVGQTIRETLTQRDPTKRANKRNKRAVNKANRDAAKESLSLDPLPINQTFAIDFLADLVPCRSTASSHPLPLIARSQSPAVYTTDSMKDNFDHSVAVQVEMTPQVCSLAPISTSDYRLQRGHKMDCSQIQLTTPVLESLKLQRQAQLFPFPLHAPIHARMSVFQQDTMSLTPPLPISKAMASEDIEAVSPLDRAASEEWFLMLDDGCKMQDDDFDEMEQLFGSSKSTMLMAAC